MPRRSRPWARVRWVRWHRAVSVRTAANWSRTRASARSAGCRGTVMSISGTVSASRASAARSRIEQTRHRRQHHTQEDHRVRGLTPDPPLQESPAPQRHAPPPRRTSTRARSTVREQRHFPGIEPLALAQQRAVNGVVDPIDPFDTPSEDPGGDVGDQRPGRRPESDPVQPSGCRRVEPAGSGRGLEPTGATARVRVVVHDPDLQSVGTGSGRASGPGRASSTGRVLRCGDRGTRFPPARPQRERAAVPEDLSLVIRPHDYLLDPGRTDPGRGDPVRGGHRRAGLGTEA